MNTKLLKKKLSKEQALQKISRWCALQDRSTKEVKEKLYGWGLWKQEVDEILVQLFAENFLNEERYAENFARGKFRMKQWGKIKIRKHLREKGVSETNIQLALKKTPEEDYRETVRKLVEKKWNSVRGKEIVKKDKTAKYLLSKGFEWGIVYEEMEKSMMRF